MEKIPDDVKEFLSKNPQVESRGIGLWGSESSLAKWLTSKTPYSVGNGDGRVMDMDPDEIVREIGRIECGIF